MQLRLQRELFTPNNEQLLGMVHCLRITKGITNDKDKNKAKDIFLCIVNEADRFSLHGQLNINLVEVKGDKRGDLPKRKRAWTLHELRSIDGKHSDQENQDALFPGEFDLVFGDKFFSYKAVNYEEKKRFLTRVFHHSCRK